MSTDESRLAAAVEAWEAAPGSDSAACYEAGDALADAARAVLSAPPQPESPFCRCGHVLSLHADAAACEEECDCTGFVDAVTDDVAWLDDMATIRRAVMGSDEALRYDRIAARLRASAPPQAPEPCMAQVGAPVSVTCGFGPESDWHGVGPLQHSFTPAVEAVPEPPNERCPDERGCSVTDYTNDELAFFLTEAAPIIRAAGFTRTASTMQSAAARLQVNREIVDRDGDNPVCLRCDKKLEPIDMQGRCPRNPARSGMHEVLVIPEWKPGDPVRQGSSLHAGHCPRSNPSVYANYEPCECHMAAS